MMKKTWHQNIQFIALAAAIATVFVYLPALNNGFVAWDDNEYIYANDFILNLNAEFLAWAFTEFHSANWHPLTWISHALDYAIWGLDPWGHHLTSILLHGANTYLVVIFTFTVLQTDGVFTLESDTHHSAAKSTALITGLLFGLHPIHVESVAWVSERKDLLCAFFYLASLIYYLRFKGISVRSNDLTETFQNQNYLVCLLFFALASMSKPMAISLPFVLILIDWLHGDRLAFKRVRQLLMEKTPFFVLALALAGITILAQNSEGAVHELEVVSLSDRLWVASHALIAYLGKMAWPSVLLPFYSFPQKVNWVSLQYLGSALLLLLITVFVLASSRRKRGLAVAWAYYLITLLPVLGIVKVGGQAMADRYTYLPSIAPFLMFALALVWIYRWSMKIGLNKRLSVASLIIISLIIFTTISFKTQKQTGIWKSGNTLWRHVLEYDDQVAVAYRQLGLDLALRGEWESAKNTLSQALPLAPKDSALMNLLAISHMELGNLDAAQEFARRAVSLDNKKAAALNTLGEIYLARENFTEANRVFQRAAQMDPDNPIRFFNLAISFDKLNDDAQSCIYWRRYMELDLSGKNDDEILERLKDIGCSSVQK